MFVYLRSGELAAADSAVQSQVYTADCPLALFSRSHFFEVLSFPPSLSGLGSPPLPQLTTLGPSIFPRAGPLPVSREVRQSVAAGRGPCLVDSGAARFVGGSGPPRCRRTSPPPPPPPRCRRPSPSPPAVRSAGRLGRAGRPCSERSRRRLAGVP
jgi:hypothetical protein